MIIKEMRSHIACTHCGYGFDLSTMTIHQKLEKAYDDLFKTHLGQCRHCTEGKLVIVNAKFTVKHDAERYELGWRCSNPKCGMEWTQHEYISRRDMLSKNLINHFMADSTVCCPNEWCKSKEKKLIRMSKA
jgi:hypothetical protein